MTEVSKTNNTQSNLVQIWSCAADVSPSAAQLRQFIAGRLWLAGKFASLGAYF